MPIGSFASYGKIIQGVLMTNPKTVLDLGIGFGMNGAGIRNWMDLGYKDSGVKTHITGVEVFEKYRNPVWDLYDEIVIQDIRDYLSREVSFDTIIMTDVIEHFHKAEGEMIIERLKEMCRKTVLVSTPAMFHEQGAVYGNEAERHRSSWSTIDFMVHGFGITKDGKPDEFGHEMIVAEYVRR